MKSGPWTVQRLIDEDMTVMAYCHDAVCNHKAPLDLAKLRDRLGPDAQAMHGDLVGKLRCQRCGGKRGKGVGLIYTPTSGPSNPGNPYLKAKGG